MFRHIVLVLMVAVVTLTPVASIKPLWWRRRCHNPKDPFSNDSAIYRYRAVSVQDVVNRDFV
jgi:hypothetical protein